MNMRLVDRGRPRRLSGPEIQALTADIEDRTERDSSGLGRELTDNTEKAVLAVLLWLGTVVCGLEGFLWSMTAFTTVGVVLACVILWKDFGELGEEPEGKVTGRQR